MPRVLNKKLHNVAGATGVGHPSPFGNPFSHLSAGAAAIRGLKSIEDAVEAYECWVKVSWHTDGNYQHGKRLEEITGRTLSEVIRLCGYAPPIAELHKLRGKDLWCWCVDKDGNGPCHAQVLLKLANRKD